MILYPTPVPGSISMCPKGVGPVSEAVKSAERVATSRLAYAEGRATLAMAARFGRSTQAERVAAVAVFRADGRLDSLVNVSQPSL